MLFEVERLSSGGLGLRLPTGEERRENCLVGCRARHRGDSNNAGEGEGPKEGSAGDAAGSDVHVLTEETPPTEPPAAAAGVELPLLPFVSSCCPCRCCCACCGSAPYRCCCCCCLTQRIGLPPMWPINESPLNADGGCCGSNSCCCGRCSSGGAAAGGDGTVSNLNPGSQLPCCIISCLLSRSSGTWLCFCCCCCCSCRQKFCHCSV